MPPSSGGNPFPNLFMLEIILNLLNELFSRVKVFCMQPFVKQRLLSFSTLPEQEPTKRRYLNCPCSFYIAINLPKKSQKNF